MKDRSRPPTEWCDWWTEIHQLTPDIAYGWPSYDEPGEREDPNPWFWHWCTASERWEGRSTLNHTLVSREPLHLEPSLAWPCCGLHGFVHNGVWIPA